jgi:cellobiose phosphorylase
MGLRPDGAALNIEPNLPKECPEMTVRNLRYRGVPMDITVACEQVVVVVKEALPEGLKIRFKDREQLIYNVGNYILSTK